MKETFLLSDLYKVLGKKEQSWERHHDRAPVKIQGNLYKMLHTWSNVNEILDIRNEEQVYIEILIKIYFNYSKNSKTINLTLDFIHVRPIWKHLPYHKKALI